MTMAAGALFSMCVSSAQAARSEFNYSTALPHLKKPIEVSLSRNPFKAVEEPERPLPVLRDKDDPVLKLPVVLAGKVRSVMRQPKPLVLVDGNVFQPGDEVRVGSGPLIPKYRVVLKSIEDDRLVFVLISVDVQQPGQVEAVFHLGPGMRQG
jgi:hypothetical protein